MNPMLIIAGVVAFVLGIAGGTAVRVMTAPKPAAVAAADSTAVHGTGHAGAAAHADSTAHAAAPAHGDSTAAPPSAEPAGEHAAAEAPPHAVEAALAAAMPHGPVVEKVPASAVDPEERAHAFKQVGTILMNMKPAEAVEILKYMGDDHVEGILRQMGPRQAAQVLAQLPAERAASLSRRLLAPERGAK